MFNKGVTQKTSAEHLLCSKSKVWHSVGRLRSTWAMRAVWATHHPLGKLSPKILIADHILQQGDVLSSTMSALNDAEAGHY